MRESLEISGFIQQQMLMASNFGLCATVNGQFIVKVPDWVYVERVNQELGDRTRYTPNLENDVPQVAIKFLSDTDEQEYTVKRTYPPGKWFFPSKFCRFWLM